MSRSLPFLRQCHRVLSAFILYQKNKSHFKAMSRSLPFLRQCHGVLSAFILYCTILLRFHYLFSFLFNYLLFWEMSRSLADDLYNSIKVVKKGLILLHVVIDLILGHAEVYVTELCDVKKFAMSRSSDTDCYQILKCT